MTQGKTNVNVTEIDVKPRKLYLYNYGDECEGSSGGWTWLYNHPLYTVSHATKETDHLRIYELETTGYGDCLWTHSNLIDMSQYNKLYAEISVTTSVVTSQYRNTVSILLTTDSYSGSGCFKNSSGTRIYDVVIEETTYLTNGQSLNKQIVEVDISAINEASVWFYAMSSNYSQDKIDAQCYRIWLE